MTREELIKHYETRQYIGDSVYCYFDGYHFILETRNGLPNDPSNQIALEPPVFENLIRLREQCYADFNELRERESDEQRPAN